MRMLFFALIFCSFSLQAQIIEADNAGDFAPNFSYTDLSGEVNQLKDLRDQVVYIAFWASWCKPCIQGFDKYAETRKEMESLGVTLLNISIDSSPESWKKAIDQHQINGLHGLVPKQELMDDYQLYNVPRYEIVGKNGEFLYLNRDGGKSVMDNFKEFLEMK